MNLTSRQNVRSGYAWVILLALAGTSACRGQSRPRFVRMQQSTGITARLQAVMAVDHKVVWASGLEGSVVRSIDGGETWKRLRVPDSSKLQFRDVHAFDAARALLLSAGDGELSRIYKTSDGGLSWSLVHQNKAPKGFLDCFDFWDEKRGLAYGDSVDGVLVILTTLDGGSTWNRVPAESLPKAGKGEGGFAASGTCVRTGKDGRAWIGTGAGGNARVLRTLDWGQTWRASETPLVKGDAAGVISLVQSGTRLLAMGGDLGKADEVTSNAASSGDGGKRWRIASSPTFRGPVYGTSGTGDILVAVGPKGIAVSSNAGESWTALDDGDYWSVDFGGASRFWVVGPEGRILRFDLH